VSKENSDHIRTEMLIHSKQAGASFTGSGDGNNLPVPCEPEDMPNGINPEPGSMERQRQLEGQLAKRTQELRQKENELQRKTTELQRRTTELQQREREAHRANRWLVVAVSAVFLVLLAAVVPLSVLYGKKKNHSPTTTTLTISTWSSADAVPVTDSKLGAAAVVLGDMFALPSSTGPESKIVYNSNNGKICVRVKTESSWHNNVQCVEGANPLPNSPLTMLDWIGGPSIFFFTADHILSGIDYVPQNDTWKPSSVIENKIRVHDQSQIASVTWLNGASAWIYYQDLDEQIREIGLDDYRDLTWREGSVGPLGIGNAGSGIGVSRWLNGTDEVEELFYEQRDGGIAGKMYMMSAWQPDYYTVEGTPGNVPDGAGITITTVTEGVNSTILLAYVANSGFLNVQARRTTDVNYGGFSSPVQLVEGDGHSNIGLAAIGSLGVARIHFVVGQKVLELSSEDPMGKNWTTITL
jgi:hypothetical protein